MKKCELLRIWLTALASGLYHFFGGITVCLVLGIPIVLLLGNTLLSLLGHALHVLFEVFESIAGHFLEWVFHLSKRSAEIIIYWNSLAIALCSSWYLMRKAHSAARQNVLLAGLNSDADLKQFSEGLRTMTEVLETLTRLGESQLREVRAIGDYQVSIIDLAFATLLGHSRVGWDTTVDEN